MQRYKNEVKVADEVWLATALLHRECMQQGRKGDGFNKKEILKSAQSLHPEEPCRPGVTTHISQHCVANTPPNPGRYRMLYRNADGTYRLYRDGDDYHPRRNNGKSVPAPDELPEEQRDLVDWYQTAYNKARPNATAADPLMQLKGLGKEIWRELGGGDAVIDWLRSDEPATPPWGRDAAKIESPNSTTSADEGSRFDEFWKRLVVRQGEEFLTVERKPFAYELESGGLRIYRGGRRINQHISQKHVRRAWALWPVSGPGELSHEVRGPSYLFGILRDPRMQV